MLLKNGHNAVFHAILAGCLDTTEYLYLKGASLTHIDNVSMMHDYLL